MILLIVLIIFICILILLLLIQLNKKSIINKFTNVDDDFGFIIIRHVNSELTDNYWITNIKHIRKYYKNKIVIIDDNSDKTYLNNMDAPMDNVEVILSEFPKRGELLPYYYLYTKKKCLDLS